jgi:transcriptional regulator with XRE-family HTH domain
VRHGTLSNRLRSLRKSAGLTIQQLAELAGLSRQAVQHIESGKRTNPGIETIRSICKVLGISLKEFD